MKPAQALTNPASPQQQAPQHATIDVWLHSREDEVELHHLQRDGDRPVDVSVDDRRRAELHPVLTHVEA